MTVYAGGPDVDNEKLASEPDAFCEFVKAKIGRDDIRIANISWITDFRYVQDSSRQDTSLIDVQTEYTYGRRIQEGPGVPRWW